MAEHRIYGMSFASIYPHYVNKAERKGHTKTEVDELITWLTGYDSTGIEQVMADEVTMRDFFAHAPAMNPNASLITGVVCGVRVEDLDDPLMQQIRWLDKLIDELAHGKKITSIKRTAPAGA